MTHINNANLRAEENLFSLVTCAVKILNSWTNFQKKTKTKTMFSFVVSLFFFLKLLFWAPSELIKMIVMTTMETWRIPFAKLDHPRERQTWFSYLSAYSSIPISRENYYSWITWVLHLNLHIWTEDFHICPAVQYTEPNSPDTDHPYLISIKLGTFPLFPTNGEENFGERKKWEKI